MKCKHCGFEFEENFKFCKNCGAPIDEAPVEPVSLNPAADKVLPALKDKLFLVICILYSAVSVFSLALGSVSIINILLTVFMWLAYVDATKGIANEKHLRGISGTVYASYILGNVAAILLMVCGVLLGVVTATLTASYTSMGEFVDGLVNSLEQQGFSDFATTISGLTYESIIIMGWIVSIALVFGSVAALVINIISMKKIHGLTKSIYQGIMYPNPDFRYARATKGWLIFFAVCSGISITGQLRTGAALSIIVALCNLAITILAIILVDKYLIQKANKEQ